MFIQVQYPQEVIPILDWAADLVVKENISQPPKAALPPPAPVHFQVCVLALCLSVTCACGKEKEGSDCGFGRAAGLVLLFRNRSLLPLPSCSHPLPGLSVSRCLNFCQYLSLRVRESEGIKRE